MSGERRITHRSVVLIAMITGFALLAGGVASAAPGDVDLSFGDAGAKTVPVGSAAVGGIVQRSDGTYVVGGSTGNSAITVALTRTGQILGSYGTGGMSSLPVPGSSSVTITDVAMRSDERVVVAGYESPVSGSNRFVVARFRPGGAPDRSFSGDGVAKIGFPQGAAYGYGVAVQPDGRVVVVGEVDPTSGVSNPAIARLDPNGTLDRTFGDHGIKVVKVPDGVRAYDSPWRVVVTAHGKLAMAGWAGRGNGNYKTLAMRLKPGGVPDPTFSGDGFAIVDADGADNYAYGLAKDGDELVLGLHTSADEAGFIRLTGNGKRDATFGGDGVVIHALSSAWEVDAVAVRADHRIVGANGRSGGPNVVQLKAGGKLDGSFGTGGEAAGPLTGAQAADVIVLANGKIVVAGTNSGDVIAARFLGP